MNDVEKKLDKYYVICMELAEKHADFKNHELQTRLKIEKLKMKYEEEGYKSTQAKALAEQDCEKELQQDIILKTEYMTWKYLKKRKEYELDFLLQVYCDE